MVDYMIYILITPILGCFITGKLYTPKLYPADDVDVTLVLDK